MLCVYDNAGEHFQPGQDNTSSPVTRHLAHSRALLFLYDPTQDRRFRDLCKLGGQPAPAMLSTQRVARQETILNEAAARVRRHAGLREGVKHERPLIVVVSKCDTWAHLLGEGKADEPWRQSSTGRGGLDLDCVAARSSRTRDLLKRLCPEVVGAAEGFASEVTYVPVSALGPRSSIDPAKHLIGIRPSEIEPEWVTVPMLYALSRVLPGLVPRVVNRPRPASPDTAPPTLGARR